MSTIGGWLKATAAGHAHRLRAWIDTARGVAPRRSIPRGLLRNWGIRRFRVDELLGDTSAVSWLVTTDGGRFVVRHISGPTDYLDYQVLVMRHLGASTFPFDVPVIIRSVAGDDYFSINADSHWLLYPFLEGEELPQPPGPAEAAQVGTLVGQYHCAIASLDAGASRLRFGLPLFEVDRVLRSLEDHAAWARLRDDGGPLERLLAEQLPEIVPAYRRIPAATIENVIGLPTATIYNDWHRYNMMHDGAKITGLIDFDSLAIAPRLVDFQNALVFLLLDCNAPDHALVAAFADGYHGVTCLTSREVPLVVPLMLDRVATRIAKVVDWVRSGTPAHDEAIRLVGLFRWLTAERDCIVEQLEVSAAAWSTDAE